MAGRELARAGHNITVLEARDRIGGRIWELPESEFGYRAEGGAEFIHGDAPVTKKLIGDAGLTLVRGRRDGERLDMRGGKISDRDDDAPGFELLPAKLGALKHDMPIAKFLDQNFAGEQFAALRRSIIRTTEGYDAADPNRASTFALREEWLGGGLRQSHRVEEGYGALMDFLAAEIRNHGGAVHFNAEVKSIAWLGGATVRCANGAMFTADRIVNTVPLPVLHDIDFGSSFAAKLRAADAIGYGDVIKILLGFKTIFWARAHGRDMGGTRPAREGINALLLVPAGRVVDEHGMTGGRKPVKECTHAFDTEDCRCKRHGRSGNNRRHADDLPTVRCHKKDGNKQTELRLVSQKPQCEPAEQGAAFHRQQCPSHDSGRKTTILSRHRIEKDSRRTQGKKASRTRTRYRRHRHCVRGGRCDYPSEKRGCVGNACKNRRQEQDCRRIVPPQVPMKIVAGCRHFGGVVEHGIVGLRCRTGERRLARHPNLEEIGDNRPAMHVQHPAGRCQHPPQQRQPRQGEPGRRGGRKPLHGRQCAMTFIRRQYS